MRPTMRFWVLAGLAAVAGLWALFIGRPLLVFSVCGVCAWLLAQQYRFLAAVGNVSSELELTQNLSSSRTVTEATTYLTVAARVESTHSLTLQVIPSVPVVADGAVDSVWLGGRTTDATETYELQWPVAGTFQFESPSVAVRDRLGLFEETLQDEREPTTITVETRRPRNIHVGEGGEPVASGFGEHEGKQTGRGIEPAEVRKYVAGDTFQQIDWKATARLNETHVREFTTQSDRETQLFVDHRAGMATGSPGETKLAFTRHVALGFVEQAREFSDPLGCYTVGADGVTGLFAPRADLDHLSRIRRHLQSVEPAAAAATGTEAKLTELHRVRSARQRLADQASPFATRLAPFFEQSDNYARVISDRPLFQAVDTAPTGVSGALWTVILTDDEHRAELRETVKMARQRGGPVLVFMTPTVLFEPGGLDNLDEAYQEYVDFEEFRHDLASLTNVSAFEVGPADRLSSVLATSPRRTPTRTR